MKSSTIAFTSLTSELISFALADKEPNNPFTNDHILAIRLFWVEEVFSSGKNMRIWSWFFNHSCKKDSHFNKIDSNSVHILGLVCFAFNSMTNRKFFRFWLPQRIAFYQTFNGIDF